MTARPLTRNPRMNPAIPYLALGSLACALALAASGVRAQDAPPEAREPAADRWTGQVTPYLWGSGLGGNITPFAGGPSFRVEKSFGEVLEDSDGAFFLSAFARRDRLVLLGDFSQASSSRDGRVPPGIPAEGRLRQRSLTLAAGWRVADDARGSIDLLGGFRHWSVRAAVDVPLAGVSRSPQETFTDPILGIRANVPLSPRWSLVGYADVGGFGVGSDSTWQWLATFNYQPGERWVFSAGLRQLNVDYRDGGTRVDVTLAGPLIGASWRF